MLSLPELKYLIYWITLFFLPLRQEHKDNRQQRLEVLSTLEKVCTEKRCLGACAFLHLVCFNTTLHAVVHSFVRGGRSREDKGNRIQQRRREEINAEHAEEG